mmetsp:Transcript_73131/g.145041  ORF Transcript_73131/g.145041 Transcript_73131/m.145041 type:complete len:498 (-) Transcript_73131:49-1542(-)
MFASPSMWSPSARHMKYMSPPTALKRDDPSASRGPSVSANASLSAKMADFSAVPGVNRTMPKNTFVDLMRALIGEVKHLQNNPRLGIIPQEKRAATIMINFLKPYSTEAGGPLIIEELEYVPGRSNLKITYKGTGDKTVSFIGSHLDAVPADPETWDRDPFTMLQEGDRLYGRGTTDCLGHVAMTGCFLQALATARPKLKRTLVVVFIAAEESPERGVGVDKVLELGKVDECRNGPVYWVDSADSQPCCGSAGVLSWSLKSKGRLFHSGFPNKAINSIELASEAVSQIQARFYEDFPPHPGEDRYQFSTGSHMKPTQIECAKGSLNQICPETTVSGDIRLSPFYNVEDVMEHIEKYVEDLNAEMEHLPCPGTWTAYKLPDNVELQAGERRCGELELKWLGDLNTFKAYSGIAVKLDSEGHKALVQAFRETNSSVKPFSVSGSLPLVKMMQEQGFDIQICGFGHMSVYHGVNEYCTIAEMQKGYEVILRTVCLLEVAA